MPYRPTSDDPSEQLAKWASQNPEAYKHLLALAAKEGTTVDDPKFQQRHADIMPVVYKPLHQKKRDYYDENPEGDPQSYTSWLLEQFGLDEPYREDSGSYDYRHKKWQQSQDSGNPDLSWMFPVIPEPYQLEEGGNRFLYGEDYDPRDWKERTQAAILNGMSWPALGFEKEAMAGMMSILPGGGTYEQELDNARNIENRDSEFNPHIGINDVAATVLGLPAMFGSYGGVSKAWSRLAPKTLPGKVAKYAAMPAGSSAYFTGMEAGSQPGDTIQDKFSNVSPETPIVGAVFPVVAGAPGVVSKGARYVKDKIKGFFSQPNATVIPKTTTLPVPQIPSSPARNRAPKRKPKEPGGRNTKRPITDPSVRDDINRAIFDRGKRRPRRS